MSLLEIAQQYEDLAKAIKSNEQAFNYLKHKLDIATESLALMALKCPDVEAARRAGTVLKLRKAFDNNIIDISYSLPVIIATVMPNDTMKRINTWEELVEVLNEID